MAQIKLVDTSAQVLRQLNANVQKLLLAWGTEGVALVVDRMETGYGKPIRDTGNLERDVQYAVENSSPNTVDIGNTLEYGPYVHNGTSRMAGRAYLRDGLIGGAARLQEVAEEILSNGFK